MKMFWRLIGIIIILMMVALMEAFGQPYVKAEHLTYSVIYDYKTMNPAVVMYRLKEADFRGSISTRPRYFKADHLLPPPHRKSGDFTKTGFERGHLCPSGHRDARKDWFRDTYVTSNVVPMWTQTNGGAWKELELLERKLAVFGHELKCASGSILQECDTIQNGSKIMLVPRYVFKVIKCSSCNDVDLVYVVPNERRYQSMRTCNTDSSTLKISLDTTIYNYIKEWISQ